MKKFTSRKLAVTGTALGAVGLLAYGWWPLPKREKVLQVALNELGTQDWRKYMKGVTIQQNATDFHWCGVFALWVLHQAGLARNVKWDLSTGKGFLYRLPMTKNPKPGDLAYFHNLQHHAIVERVDGNFLYTIDGNSGNPSKVRQNRRPISSAAAFYSIEPFLNAAKQN